MRTGIDYHGTGKTAGTYSGERYWAFGNNSLVFRVIPFIFIEKGGFL